MIASQFNLDHRLNELRQVNGGRCDADALGARQHAANPAAAIARVIRTLLGGQAPVRTTRIAAG
jgi:hypothetical protein